MGEGRSRSEMPTSPGWAGDLEEGGNETELVWASRSAWLLGRMLLKEVGRGDA